MTPNMNFGSKINLRRFVNFFWAGCIQSPGHFKLDLKSSYNLSTPALTPSALKGANFTKEYSSAIHCRIRDHVLWDNFHSIPGHGIFLARAVNIYPRPGRGCVLFHLGSSFKVSPLQKCKVVKFDFGVPILSSLKRRQRPKGCVKLGCAQARNPFFLLKLASHAVSHSRL